MSKWRPSNTAKKKFAKQMREIEEFCSDHGISQSGNSDSFYFTVNGTNYRVSNHSVEASDNGAYSFTGEQVREKYHNGRSDDTVYIHASKTRIIEIYTALKDGYTLDARGKIIR